MGRLPTTNDRKASAKKTRERGEEKKIMHKRLLLYAGGEASKANANEWGRGPTKTERKRKESAEKGKKRKKPCYDDSCGYFSIFIDFFQLGKRNKNNGRKMTESGIPYRGDTANSLGTT